MADPIDPTGLNSALSEQSELVKFLTKNYQEFNSVLPATNEGMAAIAKTLGISNDQVLKVAGSIGGDLYKSLKGTAEIIGAAVIPQFANLANPLKETQTDMSALARVMGETFANSLVRIQGVMKNLISTQQIMREAIVVSGQSVQNASEFIKNYPQAVREMSAATGFGLDKINDFNKVVGRVMPESLRLMTKDSVGLKDAMGGMIQPTTVAMAAFKTFGIEGSEAAQKTLQAFLEFNQSPISTAKNLGIMARAAKDTGVDLQTAQNQITDSSKALAIFGRQTGESGAVWRTFAETLKAGGVPIAQVGEIVKNVTGSIAGMSMENRAFIGMMSGLTRGASALGGALKLELAMRQEGGMQKNLEALTSTLGKFAGGRIITLEQAANNPQLEQQFTLQRQMLGKLTGITTTEQQNRILEVMQKVQTGGISAIDADKEMKNVFNKGKDLQQQSIDIAERTYQLLRSAFGGRIDTKLDDLNQSLRGKTPGGFGGLGALEGIITKQKTADEDILSRKEFAVAVGRFSGDVVNAGRRLINRKTASGKEGAENIMQTAVRYMTNRGHPTLGAMPTANGLPIQPLMRARVPEPTLPAITNLTSVVNRGGTQTHQDLQHLIETTRNGLAPLREMKSSMAATGAKTEATAPNSESTLTIKFDGGDMSAINRIKKAIKEEFDKNMLGIY